MSHGCKCVVFENFLVVEESRIWERLRDSDVLKLERGRILLARWK